MSRCRYLDICFWPSAWKKALEFYQKYPPHKDVTQRNLKTRRSSHLFWSFRPILLGSEKGSEKHRQCLHFDVIHCSICYFFPAKQRKPENKKNNEEKKNKNGTSKGNVSLYIIGSMGLVNICLTFTHTKIKPFMDRYIFYRCQILQIYGLHSGINDVCPLHHTCGKIPRMNLYQIGPKKKGDAFQQKNLEKIPSRVCYRGCVVWGAAWNLQSSSKLRVDLNRPKVLFRCVQSQTEKLHKACVFSGPAAKTHGHGSG